MNEGDASHGLGNPIVYSVPFGQEASVSTLSSSTTIEETHAASFSIGALATYGPQGEAERPEGCLVDLRLTKPIDPVSYRIENGDLKFTADVPGCYVFKFGDRVIEIVAYSQVIQAGAKGGQLLKDDPALALDAFSNQVEIAIGSPIRVLELSNRMLEIKVLNQGGSVLVARPTEADIQWRGLVDKFNSVTSGGSGISNLLLPSFKRLVRPLLLGIRHCSPIRQPPSSKVMVYAHRTFLQHPPILSKLWTIRKSSFGVALAPIRCVL